MGKIPKKLYLVWEQEDADSGYLAQYDTLEDAVRSSTDKDVQVYGADVKLLGTFTLRTECVKVPKKPGRPKKST